MGNMPEKQKTPPDSFIADTNKAIELTRPAPEPVYDKQIPEWLNDRSFLTASARAAQESIVDRATPKAEPEPSAESKKGKKVLKAVGVGVGITAIAAGAVGFGNLVLDAAEHQISHNEEVNREALQQQEEFQRQLDNGIVYVDPVSEVPSDK